MQRGRWGARGGARRASPIATKPPLGCRGPGGVTSWTMTGETSTTPSDAPRALARCGSGHSRWRARAGGGLQVRHAALPGRRDAQGHVAATTSCATRCTPRATAGSGRRPSSTPASTRPVRRATVPRAARPASDRAPSSSRSATSSCRPTDSSAGHDRALSGADRRYGALFNARTSVSVRALPSR